MKKVAQKKNISLNKKDVATLKRAAYDFSTRFEKVMRDLSRG